MSIPRKWEIYIDREKARSRVFMFVLGLANLTGLMFGSRPKMSNFVWDSDKYPLGNVKSRVGNVKSRVRARNISNIASL